MDDIVKAALKKWPNVPACYGWLALDARGDWYMRDDRTQAAGPFPQIKIIPTGGVSLTTAADFIKAGASALGVGTDLVDVKAIREGNPRIVTDRAKQFLDIVREARA